MTRFFSVLTLHILFCLVPFLPSSFRITYVDNRQDNWAEQPWVEKCLPRVSINGRVFERFLIKSSHVRKYFCRCWSFYSSHIMDVNVCNLKIFGLDRKAENYSYLFLPLYLMSKTFQAKNSTGLHATIFTTEYTKTFGMKEILFFFSRVSDSSVNSVDNIYSWNSIVVYLYVYLGNSGE